MVVASGTTLAKKLQPFCSQHGAKKKTTPVTLPPGRLRLGTDPHAEWDHLLSRRRSGSSRSAAFAARAPSGFVTIRVTGTDPTKSAASAASRLS